jgi:hypothetical protein
MPVETGVRRAGPVNIDSLRFHVFNGRRHNAYFFIAKQTVFARAVDPGNGNARLGKPTFQEAIRDADDRLHALAIKRIEELTQRNVGRDMNDLQLVGVSTMA